MRECPTCDKEHDNNHSYCVSCRKIYDRNRRIKYRDRLQLQAKEKRIMMIQWVNEIKSTNGCKECGFSHIATIDFHHRDPTVKEVGIAQSIRRGWSKKRILKEIEKCDILCSNCHRILHWGQDNELV